MLAAASLYSSDFAMAYSVGFREAVAYSLSCLNERNQTSRIRHREIRRVYGMVSKRKLRLPQVFWDMRARTLAVPVFPPVTLIKQGLGTRLGHALAITNTLGNRMLLAIFSRSHNADQPTSTLVVRTH